MGREVRRVPKNWYPPRSVRYGKERLQPHHDEDFESALYRWVKEYEEWKTNPTVDDCEYWEWAGKPPDPEHFRPRWTEEERTHFMMYECTSEGTPISPAFETPEGLARWLVDNSVSAFAGQTASYEAWLRIAKGGYSPSAVVDGGVIRSGVEALKNAT